jgi:translation elongation factor EF-4
MSPRSATAATSRARKLLEKQKEGKKKMRQFGKVDIRRKPLLPR